MKAISFIALFVCTVTTVCAQQTPPYKYLGNYTQPAPNAAALGKYVDYPVGYYTGTPQISVPIYELKDGAAALPISLSYHASGIRVSETASWIGLGWALNAGGMIARSVKGGPDEGVANPQSLPGGYYKDSGITKMSMLPYPINGIIPINQEAETRRYFLTSVSAGNADCEPDLYTFNFNGYSGKFVFDEGRTPRLLTDQDLKIAVNFDGSNFTTWVITTPDGAKYYFGENNMREVSAVFGNEILDANTNKPSSWLLTRIVYPNTKDTVYFSYTPETYGYFDLGAETTVYDGSNPAHDMKQGCSAITSVPPANILRTKVSGLRLTNIRSRNYSIAFVAKTQRQDLISYSGSPFPYKLDSIKIFNDQNQCIKQFLLSHAYFTSTTATSASSGILGIMNGDVSDTKRLKLTAVREFSGDGLTAKPPYAFAYQEALQLPRRISFDQDHWGFSNNAAGNTNDRFTPKVEHPICLNSTGPWANRNSKWPDMQACSIKSITDPLGVVTLFDFEPHSSSLTSFTSMVGGLRIHKITARNTVRGDSTVRLYDYGNGGVLYNIPKYLIESHNEFYFPMGQKYTSYIGYDMNEFRILRCMIKQSQSIVPLQDFQGNHIGYSIVKEIFGEQGEGGFKQYAYMADNYGSTSRLDLYNYAALATINNDPYGGGTSSGLYGNGHFNDINPQDLQYGPLYGDQYYPYTPSQVDLRRGQLLNEETYDLTGNIIKAVYNNYQQKYNETYWMRGFKLYRSASPVQGGTTDALAYYKLHTGISQLASTTTKDYKDGKEFITTVNYDYESAYHIQQTGQTTITSQGDILIDKTYYSFDYANNATADNVFAKMKGRNMVLPVSKLTWKNSQLVSGQITQYADYSGSSSDTFVNPSKIHVLETVNPLTSAQAGISIALTGQLATLIPSTYFKEKASFVYNNNTGKLAEQKLVNDKTQGFIWDNEASLPLAIADNAVVADIAYSGFESNEKGNWTYNISSIVSDATAPTGTQAYTLSSSYPITKTTTAAKSYTLSYWYKAGAAVTITGGTQGGSSTGVTINGWTYRQVTISGAASVSIAGSGSIDELRLYPVNAQMQTYSYDSLLRLIAECSANNLIKRYEYDALSRLVAIKDQYGRMVKAFEYNYGASAR
jgi:YD repeat-containing protein